MAKAKRKIDRRLEKRLNMYSATMGRTKSTKTSGFKKPGSRKKKGK